MSDYIEVTPMKYRCDQCLKPAVVLCGNGEFLCEECLSEKEMMRCRCQDGELAASQQVEGD
jgi:hypothetical protein